MSTSDNGQQSVFQSVDQQAVLERLDSMGAEEESDGFFDRDFLEAEAASTNSLEVGITTLLNDGVREASVPEQATAAPVSYPGIPDDPELLRAFILGGPHALST
jgi:hypothetical protein